MLCTLCTTEYSNHIEHFKVYFQLKTVIKYLFLNELKIFTRTKDNPATEKIQSISRLFLISKKSTPSPTEEWRIWSSLKKHQLPRSTKPDKVFLPCTVPAKAPEDKGHIVDNRGDHAQRGLGMCHNLRFHPKAYWSDKRKKTLLKEEHQQFHSCMPKKSGSMYLHKHLHPHVHSSIIYSSPTVEITQMFTNWWMDTWNVVCMLLQWNIIHNKKQSTSNTCYAIHKPWKHAMWKKLVIKNCK